MNQESAEERLEGVLAAPPGAKHITARIEYNRVALWVGYLITIRVQCESAA
jgi:hypothetical protein